MLHPDTGTYQDIRCWILATQPWFSEYQHVHSAILLTQVCTLGSLGFLHRCYWIPLPLTRDDTLQRLSQLD